MNTEITIDNKLKEQAPNICLGVITCKVKVIPSPAELVQQLSSAEKEATKRFIQKSLTANPIIRSYREVYRSLRKDPSRYRVSSEALIRRILQGKGIYRVNNVVDINNLISIRSLYSLGSYNLRKLYPPITFRIGKEHEGYKGIGKGFINVKNLPVLSDKEGPFGSPTSDSQKAMITEETEDLLMVLFSFSGKDSIEGFLKEAERLLKAYASATQTEIYIIT